MKQKQRDITLSLVSYTDVEKSCFSCSVKIPYQQFLTFLSFMNIVRSSFSQMFFKIGAVKNYTIFWIKHSCLPVNIAKFLRTAFSKNFSCGCFCIILKVNKQLFRQGCLDNCPRGKFPPPRDNCTLDDYPTDYFPRIIAPRKISATELTP